MRRSSPAPPVRLISKNRRAFEDRLERWSRNKRHLARAKRRCEYEVRLTGKPQAMVIKGPPVEPRPALGLPGSPAIVFPVSFLIHEPLLSSLRYPFCAPSGEGQTLRDFSGCNGLAPPVKCWLEALFIDFRKQLFHMVCTVFCQSCDQRL